jgi:hypothetical protein
MWSILPAAAILLAQAQPDLAEKWCFERGQHGAQLCKGTETACNDLLATGPCLRVQPIEQSGSTAPPAPVSPTDEGKALPRRR